MFHDSPVRPAPRPDPAGACGGLRRIPPIRRLAGKAVARASPGTPVPAYAVGRVNT